MLKIETCSIFIISKSYTSKPLLFFIYLPATSVITTVFLFFLLFSIFATAAAVVVVWLFGELYKQIWCQYRVQIYMEKKKHTSIAKLNYAKLPHAIPCEYKIYSLLKTHARTHTEFILIVYIRLKSCVRAFLIKSNGRKNISK